MGEFLNTILRQTLPHVYNYGSHGQNMFDFASDLKKETQLFLLPIPDIPG